VLGLGEVTWRNAKNIWMWKKKKRKKNRRKEKHLNMGQYSWVPR
jgi:hypothetical protein